MFTHASLGGPLYHELPMEEGISGYTYRDAGVDIDAGQALVEAIRPMARSTARAGVVDGIGGFGALFDPRAAGYKDPILVAATDGVGTKPKLASTLGRHDTVGIDLVAMCVNDLVVEGAEPLFFLDYFATGRLDEATAGAVLAGIAEGCRRAGCALIGGETAEMPGMYAGGDYDLAGFAVGAAERGRLLTGAVAREGDVVLALASSGLHANGFSLVRRIVAAADVDLHAAAPFDRSRRLGDALLEPTRIYVAACLAAIRAGTVRALAHVTGGGLMDNLPRVLPPTLAAEFDLASWSLPAVFRWVAELGDVRPTELARTFNCGLGMLVVVAPEREKDARRLLEAAGETVYTVGRLVPRPPGGAQVLLGGADEQWPS